MMLKPNNTFGNKYQLQKLIDARGIAEVWEAVSDKTNPKSTVALKIFPQLDLDGIKEIENGFADQSYLEHGHLLSARNLGVYKNRPYLEMHFCKNGNAGNKIRQLKENELTKCLHQIACAIAYLHDNSILHKHITPDNILIDDNGYYCYLPDLGLGSNLRQIIEKHLEADNSDNIIGNIIPSTGKKNTTQALAACYRAPELFEPNAQASTATDVWALGASMFEIATGKLPFGHLGKQIQQNETALNDLPNHFSSNFNSLIKKCLSKNKADRPTAKEIVELTYTKIDGDELSMNTEDVATLKNNKYKLQENAILNTNENVAVNNPIIAVDKIPVNNSIIDKPLDKTVIDRPKNYINKAVPLRNRKIDTPKKKTINWKRMAASILLPLAIGGGILLAVHKSPAANKPEDDIRLIPEQGTEPDTNLVAVINKKPTKNLKIADTNTTPIIHKILRSKIVLPDTAIDLPKQKIAKPPVLVDVTKQKQTNYSGILKQKQPTDLGIPKRKDHEQNSQ